MIHGATVTVGSPRLAEENGVLSEPICAQAAVLEAEGKTVVLVWRDETACGLIALRDELRISEIPDSDYAKSRTAVSVIPGQLGHG
jgi:cation transport ATPase